MFSFLSKLEVRYPTIARCPTKKVSGFPFYDKIPSQTWYENTFIQNAKILLQCPEISYKRVKGPFLGAYLQTFVCRQTPIFKIQPAITYFNETSVSQKYTLQYHKLHCL